MFGTIRRHQNWLWAIIIAVIIISFVVFFSPNVQLGGGSDDANFGTLAGKPITREQFGEAYRETHLFYFLRFGEWPENEETMRQFNFDKNRETYNRLLMIEQMQKHNVRPTDAAVAQWIKDLFLGNRPDAPAWNIEIYNRFVKERLNPKGLDAVDFERFARHEVGRQHLVSLFGLGGKLVSPAEAEELYRNEYQPMAVEVAIFNGSNYLSQVVAEESAVQTFFTNTMPNYRILPRTQVKYVKFAASNYLAEAEKQISGITNINAALEAEYAKRGGTNFFVDKDKKPLSMEEAKKQIRAEELDKLAMLQARRAASGFLSAVVDRMDTNPADKNAFTEIAGTNKLNVQLSQPFDERDGPEELNVPSDFQRIAFQLTPERPVASSVIQAEDAHYVIALEKKLPSEMPTYANVREKVLENYKQTESARLARQDGEKFHIALTNGMAQGKSFDDIAKASKVTALELPPFTQQTRTLPETEGKVPLGLLQNIIGNMTNLQTSPYIPTGNGGVVVQMRERMKINEADLKKELPDFVKRIREQRQFAAFAEWFQKQGQQLSIPPEMLKSETASAAR